MKRVETELAKKQKEESEKKEFELNRQKYADVVSRWKYRKNVDKWQRFFRNVRNKQIKFDEEKKKFRTIHFEHIYLFVWIEYFFYHIMYFFLLGPLWRIFLFDRCFRK